MFKPENVVITSDMLKLIAELDEFKGAWCAFKNIAPDRLASLRQVATIESVGSSTRIEGAKLSDREVEALLSRLELKSFQSRDEEEVAGYAEVIDEVFQAYEHIAFSENVIKQFHSWLLKYSVKDERHRGEYKTLDNYVEAFGPNGQSVGVVFKTVTPFETPLKMKEFHPLLITAIFVVVFLAIHPFQDGNGRLSRVLTTLLLLKTGYAYVPHSSLESVIEENKESYYLALRRTQGILDTAAPDWVPWVLFFLRSLQKQKANLEQKIAYESISMTSLPALSVKILELAKLQGRIKTLDIEKLTAESRSTIKARLNDLVDSGHLLRHGKGRSTWYRLG